MAPLDSFGKCECGYFNCISPGFKAFLIDEDLPRATDKQLNNRNLLVFFTTIEISVFTAFLSLHI